MQLLDLPFTDMLGLHPDPGVERPCRILQKLLLPGINLIGVNLIAHGEIRHRRLLPQRLQGDLRAFLVCRPREGYASRTTNSGNG